MTKSEFEKLGKWLRHRDWALTDPDIREVLFVGEKRFFARDNQGREDSWNIDTEWVAATPPKKKRVLKLMWNPNTGSIVGSEKSEDASGYWVPISINQDGTLTVEDSHD